MRGLTAFSLKFGISDMICGVDFDSSAMASIASGEKSAKAFDAKISVLLFDLEPDSAKESALSDGGEAEGESVDLNLHWRERPRIAACGLCSVKRETEEVEIRVLGIST